MIGAFLTIQIAVLLKTKKRAFYKQHHRYRDYFWSILFFNGICIKKNANKVLVRVFTKFEGFLGCFFLKAPNVLKVRILRETKYSITKKAALMYLIPKQHKILRNLRRKFS
jgi:hypothetical protein